MAHRFQEALSDFQLALVQLRGNSIIDYTQLGLRFRLQAWEVRPWGSSSASCPGLGGVPVDGITVMGQVGGLQSSQSLGMSWLSFA